MTHDPKHLADCANALAAAGRRLGAQGLTPATSSNFSMRLDAAHIAVTVSGRDKGALKADDVMVADTHGQPVGTGAQRRHVTYHLLTNPSSCGPRGWPFLLTVSYTTGTEKYAARGNCHR